MKKNILIMITGLLTLCSCESFLDRTPLSDLSPSNYFKDKAEMKNWNAGIYDAFQSALSRRQTLFGEVRSDNVTGTNYEDTKIYMNALMPNISEANWEPFFTCISRCNTGIEMYPAIPNILESEYAPYIGQCYAMRAYLYFWGTRVWGKMPIVDKSWDGSLNNIAIPRSSLDEVKAHIFADIKEALRYFNISDPGDKYYLGKDAMHALEVEARMWYNEYEEALNASEYFVNHKSLKLSEGETDWKAIFTNPSGSKEVIFAMAWAYETDGALSGWPQLLGASNTNNGYRMTPEIFNEFIDRLRSGQGADARFWNTVDTVKIYYEASRVPLTYASYYSSTAPAVNKCIKYSDSDPEREFDTSNQVYKSHFKVMNTTDSEFALVMMRMANVMLLRAEALNKLGRGDEALDIVNRIRSRVGYLKDAKLEVSQVSNVDEVENIILDERQLELWGEGYRWFDLMRTGHLVEVMNPIYSARQEAANVTVTGFGDEGTKYWPIYYSEFESNSALLGDQNPPYTER